MDTRQQNPGPNGATGAGPQAAESRLDVHARAKNIGFAELFAVALGLGGLYLLVRVRNEAEHDRGELDDLRDTERPAAAGVDPSAWGHTYPHPDNPPAWVRDEDMWERAKERVRPHWHDYREPWAVVAHVYEQMGGRHI